MSTELLKLDEKQLIELVKFVLRIKQNNIDIEKLKIQEVEITAGFSSWDKQLGLFADSERLLFGLTEQNDIQELKKLVERILKVL